MNDHFVNVKVDREERPDLDDIYMAATMAMNHGQGGWPMTVFLTPDQQPFFAGTYFPPEDRHGRPGFPAILRRIAELWRGNRAALERVGAELTDSPARGHRTRSRRRRPGRRPRAASPTSSPPPSTPRGAASGARPSFRPPRCSGCSCWCTAAATPARCRWCAARSTAWRAAACTTSWPAASAATRPTTPGWCRTSRRCSTTTPCSRAPTSRPIRSPPIRSIGRWPPRCSTTSCAT